MGCWDSPAAPGLELRPFHSSFDQLDYVVLLENSVAVDVFVVQSLGADTVAVAARLDTDTGCSRDLANVESLVAHIAVEVLAEGKIPDESVADAPDYQTTASVPFLKKPSCHSPLPLRSDHSHPPKSP